MGQEESKEIQMNEDTRRLKQIADKEGPAGVEKFLKDNMNRWQNETVTYAVTGKSATGKSTFINKIRGVKPGDNYFAEQGSGDTTIEPTQYKNPQNERIVFWDLPGVGTLEFPKDGYIEKMKMAEYDYIFIFFDRVLSEDDIWLAGELLKLKKPFCFVRSKIDDDITRAKQNCKEEDTVLPDMRRKVESSISKFPTIAKANAVFFISSENPRIGDWEELIKHMEKKMSTIKQEAMMYSLPSFSNEVVEMKYKLLRERIKVVTAGASAVSAIPIPGIDLAINTAILIDEVRHYTNVFGISKNQLDSLDGFDQSKLKCKKVFSLKKADSKAWLHSQLGKMATLMVVESAADWAFPVIGSIISSVTTAVVVYRFLSSTLDDIKSDALLVYEHIERKVDHFKQS